MKQKDLTGQRFGRLVVISRVEGDSINWLCKCDCGEFVKVKYQNLIYSRTRSCGCLKRDANANKFEDLTGQRFGRLVAVARCGAKRGSALWLCKCDCGNDCKVTHRELKTGDTRSCGCIRKERNNGTKHGKRYEKLYGVWIGIKQRCFNPKSASYKDYGGRGISICKEWEVNFMTFYEWAHSNGYKQGLTIERIDVNGNYCPENCTWISAEKQNINKRRTVYITFKGKTQTMRAWSEELGIPYGRIQSRKLNGWSDEDTLTIPKQTKPFKKTKP